VEWRILRKLGFARTEEGMGGFSVVVPMATEGLGGVLGRKDRMCCEGLEVSGKM
jgi:hypothetical protein